MAPPRTGPFGGNVNGQVARYGTVSGYNAHRQAGHRPVVVPGGKPALIVKLLDTAAAGLRSAGIGGGS